MKSIQLYVFLTGLIFIVVGCKKGENDPLSLSSRKNRLEGIWILVSGNTLDRYYNEGTGDTLDIVSSAENGLKSTYVVSNGPGGEDTIAPLLTYAYQYEISFDKNGNFASNEYSASDTLLRHGYWYFTGKNKQLDLKNKEAIDIVISEESDGSTDTFGGSAMPADLTYYIDRLAKDELSLYIDHLTYDNTGDFWHLTQQLHFSKIGYE
jgi:hypothetical protein